MFARTPRLTLRPGWPEDAPALAHAINHRAVATRLARVPWPYRESDAAAFLSGPRAATASEFLIWSHEALRPQLVGGIALVPDARGHEHGHELGYWLTPDAWGRGYATEAGRALVDMARHALPVTRLVAYHHHDNPASGRVLRKLGFRETGCCARYSLARDAVVDSITYELALTGSRPLAMAA